MNVSREFAVDELKTLTGHLRLWSKLLESPVVSGPGGEDVPAFPDGVPEGMSVNQIRGIPIEQMKAELTAIAGRLEILVSS